MTPEEALYTEHIMLLLAKQQSGVLTEIEQQELNAWIGHDKNNALLASEVSKEGFPYQVLQEWKPEEAATSLSRINQQIYGRPARKLRRLIAVAATIGAIIIAAGLLYTQNEGKQDVPVVADQKSIVPGHNGATLTLSNGAVIKITDARSGDVATQSGVKISKMADGQLVYEVADTKSHEIGYNTLRTATGEQAKLKLPDGTVVYLNAASSLKYPTTFRGLKTRTITLTGEAYFQVAKDKQHPFIVDSRDQQIEVLGTQFNVNTFGDEVKGATKTTLEEGSIKVRSGTAERTIVPGEQAISLNLKLDVRKADMEEALAWKNGYFRFKAEKITSIMSKLSRWYQVEVEYEGKPIEETFTGTVSRSKDISQALKILQNTNDVKFKIKGRRIIVMQ